MITGAIDPHGDMKPAMEELQERLVPKSENVKPEPSQMLSTFSDAAPPLSTPSLLLFLHSFINVVIPSALSEQVLCDGPWYKDK